MRDWPTRSRTSAVRACEAIAKGARTLVISDRDSDHTKAPIPSLLAVSAVHHHLVRTKERTTVALVVESGDAREVHHIALLIGFGAAAVNPYLAFESIEDLIREGELTGIEAGHGGPQLPQGARQGRHEGDEQDGHLHGRVLHRRAGFRGDRPEPDVVDEYLTGTVSQLGGVGLDVLAEEVKLRHRRAYPENPTERVHRRLEVGGEYAVPPRGRTAPVHPGNGLPASAFDPHRPSRGLRASTPTRSTGCPARAARCAACSSFKKGVRPPVPLRRGRVRRVDRAPGSTPAR